MALACGIVLASLHGFQSGGYCINIADCSLGGPVLNLLLHMGENQNILFFLFTKQVFEQFMMQPKKNLRLIDILQL